MLSVWIIVIAYFAVLIYLGIYTQKVIKGSTTNYYVDRTSKSPILYGMALAAITLSPASFLGIPAFLYRFGSSFLWGTFGVISGLFLASVLIALPIRKYGKPSIPDFYSDRFYSPTTIRALMSVVILITSVIYLVVSLKGASISLVYILNFDYKQAVIVASVITIIYTMLGGMTATSYTAAFQYLVMLVAIWLCAFGAISYNGGLVPLVNAVEQISPRFWEGELPARFALSFFFVWSLGMISIPYVLVRHFGALDIKTAAKGAAFGALGGALFYTPMIFIGAAARILIPAITDPDFVIVEISQIFLATPLLGVLLAGILAIGMATASGTIVLSASTLVQDLGVNTFKLQFLKGKEIMFSRVLVAVIGLIGMVLTFNPPGLVVDMSAWAYCISASALLPPLLLGIYWKRATKEAAIVTMIVGTVMAIYFNKFVLIKGIYAAIWVAPVGMAIFIIVSLLTPKPPREVVAEYVERLHT